MLPLSSVLKAPVVCPRPPSAMPFVARTIRTAILIVLLLCCAEHASSSRTETVLDRQLLSRYLVTTLDAIDRAIRYVQRNAQEFNLDGVIGLREVESK